MRVSLFQYELAPESIAQVPCADPLDARLFHLPASGDPTCSFVRDLPDRIPEGALVVVNDTRVLRARLLGRKVDSGGRVELLLLRRSNEPREGRASGDSGGSGDNTERWWALGRASKGLRAGTWIDCGELRARVVSAEEGRVLVDLTVEGESSSVADAIERSGHVPLPPYIRRSDDVDDRARYQTIFAKTPGAVAAPTAGLHLTHDLVERLEARGCTLTAVTLHVGLGTFQPVTALDLDEHPMHEEAFDIPSAASAAIDRARAERREVVAIGTTVVRALESAADPARPGRVVPGSGETRLLIQPGYRFQIVDRLFTNFHLPESTLLALVAAFAGRERILAAYAEAQRRGFRFFSYGDAMLLEPSAAARRAS